MKGGINKLMRNVAAVKAKSSFEKSLIKGTYHLDSKEPKEKHVFYVIECLRGSIPQTSPRDAMSQIVDRFLKNIGSWACTTKIFIILHRCLQDSNLSQKMSQELKSKEHLLHSYQKKATDTSYESKMYAEISQLYNSYIKFLYNAKLESPVLNCRMTDLSPKMKQLAIQDLLKTYENFDALISEIFNIFEHQNFCKRTRLLSNVVYLLFQDLITIYKVFYVLVTEILERFSDLNIDQAKKSFVAYQNFVNLTQTMKGKSSQIMSLFGFTVKMPEFYQPDSVLVQTLKVCIEEKQKNPKGLQDISKQLRGGMNRNQFQTNFSQGAAPKDELYTAEDIIFKSFKQQQQEQESDSGEDFDYGEEEEEDDFSYQQHSSTNASYQPQKDDGLDLMTFISNMDVPQTANNVNNNSQQPSLNQQMSSGSSTLDDLFNFGPSQTNQTQQQSSNQFSTSIMNQNSNNFSFPTSQPQQQQQNNINTSNFFDGFNQNQNPNAFQTQQTQYNFAQQQQQQPQYQQQQTQMKPQQQNVGFDPLFDLNKPLISSSGINHIQQTNQLETFKNLYTNVSQQQVGIAPSNLNQQSQQQQQPQQFYNQGYNQMQTNQNSFMTNSNMNTSGASGMSLNAGFQPNLMGFQSNFGTNQQYAGNMNNMGVNPLMNQQMPMGNQGFVSQYGQQQQAQLNQINNMPVGMNAGMQQQQFATNQFNTNQSNIQNPNLSSQNNEFSFW
ncbi:UNKNOWN [Stylonychia lemnae]|uniref:AP180 N-terminal homology (ANTH) domain-containing protein n=1 Tax=Stylonychia lemnae TaxID=5949 RepID=A0A078A0W8_STYLE|nr:UNKNOWN [Stylonychia lemnae]|eukprot:CDW75826.1 UNKNOWN [Stylonychia lemnae]